ncbi:MAG: chemotaxis protein CheA, partial [Candidatus Dadabacteria bacterium]
MSDAYREVFLQEAGELLTELEEVLLELEQSPDDMDLVARAFRALHTIKGSGAMFGFDDVAAFTHEVETAFDRVRNGEAGVTPELIDLGLRSRDHIRALLEGRADPGEAEAILAGLRGAPTTPPAGDAPAGPQEPVAESGDTASPAVYRIRFVPPANLWLTGTDPLRLFDELRELGECRVVCHADRVPP